MSHSMISSRALLWAALTTGAACSSDPDEPSGSGTEGTTAGGASSSVQSSGDIDAGAYESGDGTGDAGSTVCGDDMCQASESCSSCAADCGSCEPGEQPTRENTGPRYPLTDLTADEFFATRTCNRQRITGELRFDQAWMKGQTFTITDCEITGALSVYLASGGAQLPVDEMPVINIAYTDLLGSLQALNATKMTVDHSYILGAQITLKDQWSPFESGPAPYTFSNSFFYQVQGTPPDHTEALHVGDYGDGYRFTNVAFVQQGPNNGTATATINFHGANAVFDGCWFLWDGDVAAYHTVYIDGPNNLVKNSWFDSGANYVYPDSEILATYENNRNVDTGELLELP